MERRAFVVSALAALAAPLIPAAQFAQAAPSYTEWNATTLTAAIESLFSCQVGPRASAFAFVDGKAVELPLIEVSEEDRPNYRWLELAPHENKVHYVTLACAVAGGDKQEAEARLAKHLYEHLSKVPYGPLVWRIKPEFVSVEETKYGHTYCTAEAVEDRLVDVSKLPADAELDVVNNSYRKVLSRQQIHRMRMRLALPELEEDLALPYFKKEGEMLAFI